MPAALARMTRLAERLDAAAGWDVAVHSTTERREALPGADFVVTSVAVDRIATWRADHDLALRHGFASVLSENGGPGGLSHTLRSVPLMVEIAADVAELAPAALMLNYTNPENRVCLAIRRHTSARAIGLCHSVAETIDDVARTLGRPRAEIDAHAAGLNHFTWMVADDGHPRWQRPPARAPATQAGGGGSTAGPAARRALRAAARRSTTTTSANTCRGRRT